MSRRKALSPERSLSRRRPTREPRARFLLLCEGRVTEPNTFSTSRNVFVTICWSSRYAASTAIHSSSSRRRSKEHGQPRKPLERIEMRTCVSTRSGACWTWTTIHNWPQRKHWPPNTRSSSRSVTPASNFGPSFTSQTNERTSQFRPPRPNCANTCRDMRRNLTARGCAGATSRPGSERSRLPSKTSATVKESPAIPVPTCGNSSTSCWRRRNELVP
jgi:hypothetical protein